MNSQMRMAIAVDLGATNIRVALVSSSGQIVRKTSEPTIKQGRNGTAVTQQIIRMIRGMNRTHRSKIEGIGIASIGPLDYRRGGPLRSPNVPFAFIPLVGPLRRTFRTPIALFNDCNAAVLAEHQFGAGRNKRNIVYITISTGIGAGVITDGKLLLGKSGNAAEVGHFTIDTVYNLPCSCGKGIGHWEGYASGRNIPRFFRQWTQARGRKVNHKFQTAKEIFTAGSEREPFICEFLDEMSKINSRGISAIIAAYDPQMITLGGSVVLANKDIILKGIKKYTDNFLRVPIIKISPLGEDITLLGAGAAMRITLKENRKSGE